MTALPHISANQWRTTILKACVGAYVARGVADEISDACLMLLKHGCDPLPELLELLEHYDPQRERGDIVIDQETATLGHCRVLRDGPSIVDLAQAGKTVSCEIDNPRLLFGLVTSRSADHALVFEYLVDGQKVAGISAMSSGTASVSLRLLSTGEMPGFPNSDLIIPAESDWIKLSKFADQILVPADDSNRADAGAGLTDND